MKRCGASRIAPSGKEMQPVCSEMEYGFASHNHHPGLRRKTATSGLLACSQILNFLGGSHE